MNKKTTIFIFVIIFFGSQFSHGQDKFQIKDKPCTEIKGEPKSLLYDSIQIIKEFEFDKLIEVPSYYNGLKPRYEMAIGLYINNHEKNSLTIDGGFCSVKKCLILKVKNQNIVIDSQEKAKEYFAPITNKNEALSYLTLVTNSYPLYEFSFIKDNFRIIKHNLNKTYVKSLVDGYEVHLFKHEFFGSEHPYLEITYKIDTKGNFNIINEEELFFNPEEDGFSVD